jgi:AcrR family transcriptional regulator
VKGRESVKRPYQSPLRAAQAGSTRRAVIAAAARLFSENGYVATSIDDIAAAAGVSRATVFTAVGGKPALLKTALDVAIVGDDEQVALPDRPRSRAVKAETDPRRYLALYAGIVAEIGERAAAIYEAIRGAAGADPAARALWLEHQTQRRQGGANVVSDLLGKANLRPNLAPGAAADIVWVLNDPGLYQLLVHERGWSPEQFEGWLAESLQRQLLPD